jgi:hypothetical protein
VINLKTAEALGISVPPVLLATGHRRYRMKLANGAFWHDSTLNGRAVCSRRAGEIRRGRNGLWCRTASRSPGAAGQADRSVCTQPYSSRRWSPRNRRVRRRLALATGDLVLGLDLDWPARVAEVPPHFVAHSSTNFVRQGCQCLAGGSAAAFKRAVIHVE